MDYQQTIEFLFSSLPMYQRIGDAAIKKDLTNTRLLCDLLDQPHEKFLCIHVAGTNGKGSTSHMLASVFQAAGKKTGLYTSPHYVDFRERIKINGQKISELDVIRFVEKWNEKWQSIQPSFFEITVAMAFDHFRNEKVDIAIIETGLGGRLDSTNIITPMLSVITNIGYDHMQMLGHTLPEIASEKAGIIKRRIPVIIGEWQKETAEVFKVKAKQEDAPISFASKHIFLEHAGGDIFKHQYAVRTQSKEWVGKIESDLTGPYQRKNIRTVLEAIWCWNKYYPDQKIQDAEIRKGLKAVKKDTSMIGRWMIIRENPFVIADAAHNVDGIKSILPELLKIPAEGRHFVLGFVGDKDVRKILALFPNDGHYYWCSPDIPRGKPAQETMMEGRNAGLGGNAFQSVMAAYENALQQANRNDLVFVGGSSYVVGDFLAGMKKNYE
ncbi:MAG TPA: folylpolyglutamate synthase/dihydrofolate synthase family protein [Saprospiraceae bacterium]|nr:folylpolyglutamate synthase/dihydrofolate synthase family protein [Saprospiraceae bacterium]